MTDEMPEAVLYVECNTDGTIGGSYYSLLYLIEGLDRQCFSPVVVFEAPCRIADAFEATRAKVIELEPFVPTRYERALLRPIAKLVKLLRSSVRAVYDVSRCLFILRRHDIRLVYINNSVRAGRPWLLASMVLRIPCVAHQRSVESDVSALGRFMVSRLRAVICISEAIRDNLVTLGVRGAPLHVIHNALDPDKIRVFRSPEEVRRELGIGSSHPVIGIVGNLQQCKGKQLVIGAVTLLRAGFPGLACVIVREVAKTEDGRRFADEVRAVIESSQLSQRVVIAGYRQDVASYMNALDVVEHASVAPEPFGRVLLEAMELRKPRVASRAGGVTEVAQDGQSGSLCELGNVEDLARALSSIQTDTVLAQRVGAAGCDRLRQEFSVSRHVQRVHDLYREILPAYGQSRGTG